MVKGKVTNWLGLRVGLEAMVIQRSLYGRSALSMQHSLPTVRRLSLSSSSDVDVKAVVIGRYVCTQSCLPSQPEPCGEVWAEK